jgi:hypothetical protein
MAKDAIIAAVAEINVKETGWTWLKASGTANATTSTYEFSWPTDTTIPNWNSFKITGVPADSITTEALLYITEEEFLKYLRSEHVDSIPDGGQRKPKYVYPIVGGFGVTPMPEQDYTITYEYFTAPTEMSANDDTCVIPTLYDYIIINFALKHYYMYKDNTQQATYWEKQADRSFADLRNTLIKRDDNAWSNMINFGGLRHAADNYRV